ncbi:MAG: RNA polymerase factor sigma-32 [Rhodospirillales bacterium]|nr:RNA polymerase factor sigma-32 [Rhodospirillales bacterium]
MPTKSWSERDHQRDPLLIEAARHPLLGPDEEVDLARRAEAGDGEALRRLVGSHLRYVFKIARRYRGWGLPMNDLVQEGTLGLVQAVRRFDPDRGVRLSTYAMWWIRSAIQEHVFKSWSIVRLGTSNAQKMLVLALRRVAEDLGGGDADASDDRFSRFAEQFNSTATEVARLARRLAGHDASLDQPAAGGRPLIDNLADDESDPEQVLARTSESERIDEALSGALAKLTPREQLVIRDRYFLEAKRTFESIGRDLGVSKDRVRQLEARALAKLEGLLRPFLVSSVW